MPAKSAANSAAASDAARDSLIVCLQDPFTAIGDSSKREQTQIPAGDQNASHQWKIEAVLSMNPPRCFAGWATCGHFVLDLSIDASITPAAGAWGDSRRATSGSRNCQVWVQRDALNKLRFSLESGACRAATQRLPRPDDHRFLHADVAFETNGSSGLTAAATAVVSSHDWSHLIDGSAATLRGLAFDPKWRHNLADADGDATAVGSWAFAVMTRAEYHALCAENAQDPHLVG